MVLPKGIILYIFLGAQIVCHAAEEINNSSEILNEPRQSLNSFIPAYPNTKNKPNRASVVYVTAANQEVQKTVQPVATNPPPQKPVVQQPPSTSVETSQVRREDSHYDTGPYAEPTGYSSFTSNDVQNNFNSFSSTGYDSYSDSYLPQSNKYGPPPKYGVPSYKPYAKPTYGVPDHSYQSYGYGAPAPAPLKPVYGVPYAVPSFFDKFKLKLDLLTLAKIVLKIVIFKKIVKFIAIICLLLFIPKLIHIKKGKDDDSDLDEDRKLRFNAEARTDQSLNTMYAFVQHAIDTYSQQQKGCEDVGCRMKNVLDEVDEKYTLSSVADMFGARDI